ncbi:hypothetical protein FLT43_16275 [Paenibacillus thiaminolyticus]|uniref:Uncharacterized protein n=1 Tax=Paenibacillus thiaminolyticus TaxID=49283 RepID=A0A3A3H3M4_PANTH|nr:hypothetical protein FLT43_16275 [Paenibacillus thiaminolyticus]RJG23794.1 hypothetical protein DQX05_12300 [Paenibacillus thiaminolyticus]
MVTSVAKSGSNNRNNKRKTNAGPKLSPQQIAVIVGLLTNALQVDSVLLDRNQAVEIVLVGSIRRKTKADKVAEQMGGVTVAELLQAILRQG